LACVTIYAVAASHCAAAEALQQAMTERKMLDAAAAAASDASTPRDRHRCTATDSNSSSGGIDLYNGKVAMI